MTKPRLLLFFGIAFTVGLVLTFVLHSERFLVDISPDSPNRFHHHFGDGATEALWVLPAIARWEEKGLSERAGVPCIPTEGGACRPYLTYPPGAFLLSYGAVELFGGLGKDKAALLGARVLWTLLVLLLSAWAIALMVSLFDLGPAGAILFSALFFSSRAYQLYADNFFGHGLSLASLGLGLAFFLSLWSSPPSTKKENQDWTILLSSFGALLAYFSWEPLPALVLLFLGFALRTPKQISSWIPLGAFSAGLAVTILLRLVQCTWAAGSWSAFLHEWETVARERMLGQAQAPETMASLGAYRAHLIHGFSLMIGHNGIYLLLASALVSLLRPRSFFLFLGVSLALGSWAFVMVQHTAIHIFTLRFSVWILIFSLGLAGQILLSSARGIGRDAR